MTNHTDILALIESPEYYDAKPHKAQADLERVRAALFALIPEPPRPQDTSDDEREAVIAARKQVLDVLNQGRNLLPLDVLSAQVILVLEDSPWRNRGRGPIRPEGITNEMVEAAMRTVDARGLGGHAGMRAALEASEAARDAEAGR